MAYHFTPISTTDADQIWNGGLDAYGNDPEPKVAIEDGLPCRHCLENLTIGTPYFVMSYKPFQSRQPYAETGPIFLHAEPCERAAETDALPAILDSAQYIVRGYCAEERIVYGSGGVVAIVDVPARIEQLFADDGIAFIHIRSAANNCFACRVDRA